MILLLFELSKPMFLDYSKAYLEDRMKYSCFVHIYECFNYNYSGKDIFRIDLFQH